MSTMSIDLDNNSIKQLLQWDRVSRQVGRWPLLTLQQANALKLKYIRTDFNTLTANKLSTELCLHTINSLAPLFKKFPGCFVIAGGFFTAGSKSDVDIFFYNTTNEKVLEIIEYVRASNFGGKDKTWSRNKNMISVITKIPPRNIPVGIVEDSDGEEQQAGHNENGHWIGNTFYSHRMEIQFILRLYETKDRIIGDFDLGGSAVLYDGHNIMFTPMGAVCNIFKCNIVDPDSRYSTTYDYRLLKYCSNKDFHVIIPEIKIGNKKSSYMFKRLQYNSHYMTVSIPWRDKEEKEKAVIFNAESNYSMSNKKEKNYIKYVINYEKIDMKILANMHLKADTYEGLFDKPHYFKKESVDKLMIPSRKLSAQYLYMIYGLFGKEQSGTFIRLVTETIYGIITPEDEILMQSIIDERSTKIMEKHDELVAIINTPLKAERVAKIVTIPDATMDAKTWYGTHYRDIGLNDVHPYVSYINNAYDTGVISENIRQALFIAYCNQASHDYSKALFGNIKSLEFAK